MKKYLRKYVSVKHFFSFGKNNTEQNWEKEVDIGERGELIDYCNNGVTKVFAERKFLNLL